ncbi:hypothetical protein [Polymorphobacter fuscus]|uniref:Uncharacterized protein n=1 Tax=Sandarakinorhabdus fusca TaxID=1439888 RepID=A0A7C9GZ67_9SPHN|nr:hypothetical protein [Polymorphobacter fuscus]KAB7644467.1 hypothetical protein F9290_14155 [Polymorphobacter fuscus]MQT18394.1 hypothetical protein [Polymorphobacter fuscus]NJC08294.1 hypothetical protein [Polymorphobacter fuscus]
MRHYAGSAMMLLVTTAVIVGSYTVNLKVSAERAQVEKLRRTLVADARNIRNLEAELRTRARLPEMQRWNDNVLMMSAPAAGQYLRSPVQLAGFVPLPAAEAPVRNAVTAPVPATAPSVAAPIVRAAYRPDPARAEPARTQTARAEPARVEPAARLVAAAWRPAPVRATQPLVVIPDAPPAHTPVDLLQDGGQ